MRLSLLEQKLGELDHRLADELTAIKEQMRQAWNSFGKNYWFPDHSIDHSERVISMIEQILAPVLPDGSMPETDSIILLSDAFPVQPLTAHELYVLLAACYLQDVGMLYLPTYTSLSVDGYNTIDQRHPEISYEFILKSSEGGELEGRRYFTVRNDEYLQLIALIIKGHSIETFDEVIRELQKQRISPEGENFRGELLAALLIMGDQLDMTRRRARFSNAIMSNPASSLQNLTYFHIPEVRILEGSSPLTRKIKIWFQPPPYPDGQGEQYFTELRSWVIGRLKLHCNKTQHVLGETAGGLRWEDAIDQEVQERPAEPGIKMPSEAVALLQESLYAQRTVGRIDLKEKLKSFLKPDQGGVITIQWPERGDQILLMDWLDALCQRYEEVTSVRLTFETGKSSDLEGIMERIACRFNLERFDEFWHEQKRLDVGTKRWDERLDGLVGIFRKCLQAVCNRSKLVLILENVHLLEKREKDWFRSNILVSIGKMKLARRPVIVLLFSDQDSYNWFKDIPSETSCYALEPFTVDELAEHFQRVLGFSDGIALTEATRIAQETGGIPSLVLGEADQKWMEHTQIWTML